MMKQCGFQPSASGTVAGVLALATRKRPRRRVPQVLFAVAVLAAGSTDAIGAAPRIAFTTSTWGNGNLSSWPDAAGSNTFGLEAADAICRARAQAAGLPEPQQFVAWLSDRDNDAYCRLLGLGGKRADNCGAVTPLPDGGPWVRADGLPFADSLSALLSGRVLSPLLTNESGERIHAPFESFTATRSNGTLNDFFADDPDCGKWTSNSLNPNDIVFAMVGDNAGTTEAWTDAGGGVSCDGTRRLICMQKGLGSPPPQRLAEGKARAFITQANVGGDLGGLPGADALCSAAAADAGLADAKLFRALLTSFSDGISVADRLRANGPWYRLDGMLFANSVDEILSGEVTTPLNVTETGAYVGYADALTGADSGGMPSNQDCSSWTSNVAAARASRANITFFAPSGGHNWLHTSQTLCNPIVQPGDRPKKIYCLSDGDVFRDGFDQ